MDKQIGESFSTFRIFFFIRSFNSLSGYECVIVLISSIIIPYDNLRRKDKRLQKEQISNRKYDDVRKTTRNCMCRDLTGSSQDVIAPYNKTILIWVDSYAVGKVKMV